MRQIETEIKETVQLSDDFHGLCDFPECLELATVEVKVGEVQNNYGDTYKLCGDCVALVEDDYAERVYQSITLRRAV
jgi:hypothetical protein